MVPNCVRLLAVAAAFLLPVQAQQQPSVPKLVADLRQSLAQNRALLRGYTWTETSEVSLKGEVKKRDQAECRYDAAGKLVKTPIGEPAETKQPRGIKGKMVAKKVDEMKDYLDRVGSLLRRYVPPEAQAMKASFDAGRASMGKSEGSGAATLLFQDYAKPGDTVTIVLDLRTKHIRSFSVDTYLDEPGDIVRLNGTFASLPGGASYLEQSVLDATSKQIQIKTTNFGHHK